MVEAGCQVCRRWDGREPPPSESVTTDCKSSFALFGEVYFYAKLLNCRSCGSTWLCGYHEDFSQTPIEAEWGERHWIWRSITRAQVEEVAAASGSHRLDIDTFGT